jgi:hypothetical protein
VAREVSARADIAWVAPTEPIEKTRARRNSSLAKAGYAEPTATTGGALQIGRRSQTPIELGPSAACSRIDVVGGAPLALVIANVWDDANTLVTAGEGSDGATLFACGKGKVRLELETRGRPGPYSVLVRRERWQDPSFVKYPLAASRMLARSADGGSMLHPGAATGARAVTLENAKLVSWESTVPAARCLRVAVGVQGDGTGVDLRVFDVGTGDEIDRSHAATGARVQACAAGNAARGVRIELRATSGKLDAIVGERM